MKHVRWLVSVSDDQCNSFMIHGQGQVSDKVRKVGKVSGVWIGMWIVRDVRSESDMVRS
jgi:hypothetical protein